jgi:hypothetical protein
MEEAMTRPELDFRTASPDEIAAGLFASGCVMLRNFTAPGCIDDISYYARKLHLKTTKAHVEEKDFISDGLLPFRNYLFGCKHYNLLDAIFDGKKYAPLTPATNTRRIAAPTGGVGQFPLCFHIDAMLHTFAFTVNFWVPFSACGVTAPSLAVIPAPFEEVLEYVGYDGEREGPNIAPEHHGSHFSGPIVKSARSDRMASRAIAEHFGDRMWTPEYQVGDAMLLTNWTIHGTHSTPAMIEGRENAELRFVTGRTLREMMAARQ